MSVTVSAFALRECGFNPPGFESRRINGSDFLIRPESSGDRFSIKLNPDTVAPRLFQPRLFHYLDFINFFVAPRRNPISTTVKIFDQFNFNYFNNSIISINLELPRCATPRLFQLRGKSRPVYVLVLQWFQ